MKKSLRTLGALAALALLATGCKDDLKDAVQVKVAMQQSDIIFDIPPVPAPNTELTVNGAPVRYNVDSLIKANNSQFSFVNVKAISVKGCQVEILNQGADYHWGHLQDAIARMASNADANPIAIANVVNNPATAVRMLDLNPTNTDLSNHLNADSFFYSFQLKNRSATTDTFHCRATIQYELTLGL